MHCNRRYYRPCATKNDFLKPWHPRPPQAYHIDTLQASALCSLDSPLLVSPVVWSAVGCFPPFFCLFGCLVCARAFSLSSLPPPFFGSLFGFSLSCFCSACFPFGGLFPPPAAGRPRLDDGAVSLCGCCAYSPSLCLLVRLVRLRSSACPLSRLARSVSVASVVRGAVWVSHDAWHQRHWPCVGISLYTMWNVLAPPHFSLHIVHPLDPSHYLRRYPSRGGSFLGNGRGRR